MRDAPRRTAWDVLLPAGIALFLLNSFVFVLLGRFNADEGWYLYGSKLVYEGLRPYQDFLFTQPPLLPYLYGLVQHFFLQSIYAGRLTSVVFSVTAFLLSIKIAVNYGGKTAGGITSLLGGTFLFGIYFQSITKTYAMTTLFFILGLFFLASSSGRGMPTGSSTRWMPSCIRVCGAGIFGGADNERRSGQLSLAISSTDWVCTDCRAR